MARNAVCAAIPPGIADRKTGVPRPGRDHGGGDTGERCRRADEDPTNGDLAQADTARQVARRTRHPDAENRDDSGARHE